MYEKECGMLVKDQRAEQGLSKKELSALLLIPLPVLFDVERKHNVTKRVS